jgi:transcriptional regulator with XRE-family HTH domain
MSNFGDLMKRLRKEQGLTLETVAKKIGSHKGYVSGIENDKVNPPSVKIIRKFAKLFRQDEKMLVRIAWADKAPALIREDALRAVAHAELDGVDSVPTTRIPLLCTLESGYAADLNPNGSVKPAVSAILTLPRFAVGLDAAATVCDNSMEDSGGGGFSRGDVVLLRREEKIPAGAAVYIVFTARQKRQALVRQVVPEQGEQIVLQPLNKDYALEFLTQDDIDAVYRVIGKIGMFALATTEAQA